MEERECSTIFFRFRCISVLYDADVSLRVALIVYILFDQSCIILYIVLLLCCYETFHVDNSISLYTLTVTSVIFLCTCILFYYSAVVGKRNGSLPVHV